MHPGFILTASLVKTMLSGFRLSAADNVDPFRFPGRTRPERVGLRTAAQNLGAIVRHSSAWAATAAALTDRDSSRLLLELCAHRLLGGRHYRLPRNDAFFWRSVEAVERELVVQRNVSRAGDYDLHLYRLAGRSGPIELEAHPMNILNSFLIEEYRFARSGVVVEAAGDDLVLDGGGAWGDTALYFADRAPAGKVFTFELEARNLDVLRRNLARNPRLAARIEVVERALWNESGERLHLAAAGPGTRIGRAASPGAAVTVAESIAIDDWRAESGARRVDFIKMDIEGAEIPALQGARRTIRDCSPKLAIATYHSIHELLTIPTRLKELHHGYDLHLAHATIHGEETIVFARPQRGAG
jgi:FkbM family methyltransferase